MLSLCFPLRQRRVVRRSATSYANRYPFPSPDFDRLAKEKGTKKNKKGKNNEKSRAPSPILGAQFRALAITGSGLHRSVVFVWSVKKMAKRQRRHRCGQDHFQVIVATPNKVRQRNETCRMDRKSPSREIHCGHIETCHPLRYIYGHCNPLTIGATDTNMLFFSCDVSFIEQK